MKRWEFESVNQASELINDWFSGNSTERDLVQNFLNCISSNGKSMNVYPYLIYSFYYASHLYASKLQVMCFMMLKKTSSHRSGIARI
jgi:hypothetical protein